MARAPAPSAQLPAPDAAAQAASERLRAIIVDEIAARGGFLPFARYLELALYAPGLGYYAGGSHKLGAGGDFVTAPELGPLFARSLAAPIKRLIDAGCAEILELGAGSGRLATDLLDALAKRDRLPRRYAILEVSAQLRARQKSLVDALPRELARRVEWLDALPPHFTGTIIANEVLDAIPFDLVRRAGNTFLELGVTGADEHGALGWSERAAGEPLVSAALAAGIPDGCTSEIHLAARALVHTLGRTLDHGAAIFIDYGFPRHEYYHEQRRQGTMMCHYRHRAHGDPLVLVGLQDITTHVDFSAIAHAAVTSGLAVLGYTSQAQFLINCGITSLLGEHDASDAVKFAPLASCAQKLLGPSEMGELFKVLAVGRGIAGPLLGFQSGDRRHRL